MLLLIRAGMFTTLYLLTTAYALGRGGRPERQAAGIMAAALLLTWVVISSAGQRFHGPEYGVALVDALMLAALVWLALTADRFWPLWLAAMQVVIVLSHLAMILKPVPLPYYYRDTIQLWSYPQIAILAVGTLRHRLRTEPSPLERWLGAIGTSLKARLGYEPGPRRPG